MQALPEVHADGVAGLDFAAGALNVVNDFEFCWGAFAGEFDFGFSAGHENLQSVCGENVDDEHESFVWADVRWAAGFAVGHVRRCNEQNLRTYLLAFKTFGPALDHAVEAELGDTGRVLLRPSGTEQLVRVMVEAADQATADGIAERLAGVVKERASL